MRGSRLVRTPAGRVCTPRSSSSPLHMTAWCRLLSQCSSKLAQCTRVYDGDGVQVPVRCVVATATIARGERLAVVPSECILDGYTAAHIIQRICNAATAAAAAATSSSSSTMTVGGGAVQQLHSYADVARALHALATRDVATATQSSSSSSSSRSSSTVDVPLTSRDALLVTTALHLLHSRSVRACVPRELRDMQSWVDAMPPRVPPLGLLLQRYYTGDQKFTPLQRRLCTHDGEPCMTLAPGMTVAAARTQLLLASLTDKEDDDKKKDSDDDSSSSNSSGGAGVAVVGAETRPRSARVMRRDGLQQQQQQQQHALSSLVTQAGTTSALQRAVTAHGEVTLTPSLLRDYIAGNAVALTQRQRDAIAAHTTRPATAAGVQYLVRLEQQLRDAVLMPLCRGLYVNASRTGTSRVHTHDDVIDDDDDALLPLTSQPPPPPPPSRLSTSAASMHATATTAAAAAAATAATTVDVLAELRWAHFMMRSRAVNVCSGSDGACQLALVPFLDMLNHSHGGANVVYRRQRHTRDVVVTATRTIAAGEEVVLHYGHRTQRAVLDDVMRTRMAASSALYSGSRRVTTPDGNAAALPVGPADVKHAQLTAHMRSIEARQRYEMQPVSTMTTTALSAADGGVAAAMEAVAHAVQPVCDVMAARTAQSTAGATYDSDGDAAIAAAAAACAASPPTPQLEQQAALAQREAVAEVRWLWRYGFYRAREERLYEASAQWAGTLRGRLAQLTDARRKGRPGEFVLGVPEHLRRLRDQREQLERERYHNRHVFPPQRV